MGIFKKIGDLVRAEVNSLLDRIEDPQKLADLAIIELEQNKKKAAGLMISAMASLKKAKERAQKIPGEISALLEESERYIKNADEERAKHALGLKLQLDQEQKILASQIAHEQSAITTIEQGLKALDDKISRLKNSAAIDASKKQLEDEDAFATFARMEEKISMSEHEIAALKELLDTESNDAASSRATASFDKHSDPQDLERELQALKNKLKD